VTVGLALWASSALALTGEVVALSGAAVARNVTGQSRILAVRSQILEGDLISTSDSAYVRIHFADQSEMVLRPNSLLRVDSMRYEEQRPDRDSFATSLLKGGFRAVSGLLGRRNPASYRVSTPMATVGIRGTHFGLLVCANDCPNVVVPNGRSAPNGLHIDLADGGLLVRNPRGEVELRVGDFAFVADLETAPRQVDPRDAIRVTLPRQATQPALQSLGPGRSGELECSIR
jgi:hypothetical protein